MIMSIRHFCGYKVIMLQKRHKNVVYVTSIIVANMKVTMISDNNHRTSLFDLRSQIPLTK